jgi:hypothetical protein
VRGREGKGIPGGKGREREGGDGEGEETKSALSIFFLFHLTRLSHSNAWPGPATIIKHKNGSINITCFRIVYNTCAMTAITSDSL